jgi:hypothetical protein
MSGGPDNWKVETQPATGNGSTAVSLNSVHCDPCSPRREKDRRSTWDGVLLPEPNFPRKEVIQPHLPVRLPCYDFTPITNPTLDACLPPHEGLARRLEVLPTFVV